MSDTVLEVKNLVTTFRINKKEYPVIRDISFEIHENETLCMVGESGCGKSVTTLSVMGLLPENGAVRSGSIKLCGEELLGMSPRQLGQVRGKKMGMIFQEPMTSLNPLLTIGYQLTEACAGTMECPRPKPMPPLFPIWKRWALPMPRNA